MKFYHVYVDDKVYMHMGHALLYTICPHIYPSSTTCSTHPEKRLDKWFFHLPFNLMAEREFYVISYNSIVLWRIQGGGGRLVQMPPFTMRTQPRASFFARSAALILTLGHSFLTVSISMWGKHTNEDISFEELPINFLLLRKLPHLQLRPDPPLLPYL